MAEDAPFSVGALLGLPSEQTRVHSADPCDTLSEAVLPARWTVSDVLLPLSAVDALTADDAAFCVRCGDEEDAELWAASRAAVRADLRSRIKLAARRLRSDAS